MITEDESSNGSGLGPAISSQDPAKASSRSLTFDLLTGTTEQSQG